MLDRLGKAKDIIRIKPAAQICGNPIPQRCILGAGVCRFFDDDHPNQFGATRMIHTAAQDQGTAQILTTMMQDGSVSRK